MLEIEPSSVDADMGVYGEIRALINPDKVKQDYDDKMVSIDYEHGYEPGDVFEWKKTNTYWLIYTQEITEDAYGETTGDYGVVMGHLSIPMRHSHSPIETCDKRDIEAGMRALIEMVNRFDSSLNFERGAGQHK